VVSIIDNFYSQRDLERMIYFSMYSVYRVRHQPIKTEFASRLHTYPVHETEIFLEKDEAFQMFKKTFENRTNLKIDKLETFIRKIFKHEIEVSAYSDRNESSVHVDDKEMDLAGVIYYNAPNFKAGTKIYQFLDDPEPSAVVGAFPNRCVFYSTKQPHSAGIDLRQNERIVQPFFIKLKKEN